MCSLFPALIIGGREVYQPFHSSVTDFLTDEKRCRRHAFIDVKEGHRIIRERLASSLAAILAHRSPIRVTGSPPTELARSVDAIGVSTGARRYALLHAIRSGDCSEDAFRELVSSLLLVWFHAADAVLGRGMVIFKLQLMEVQTLATDHNWPDLLADSLDMFRWLTSVSPVLCEQPLMTFIEAYNAPDESAPYLAARSLITKNLVDLDGCWELVNKPYDFSPFSAIMESKMRCTGAAYLSDGRLILSSSHDKTVRLWDGATGELIKPFDGHLDRVLSLALYDKLIASASSDKTVRLTSIDGKFAVICRHDKPVVCVSFACDGQHLAAASGDSVYVWSSSGAEVVRFGGQDEMKFVSWSPVEKDVVASVSKDMTVRTWKALTGQPLKEFRLPCLVFGIAWSPTGASIAAALLNTTTQLIDVSTENFERVLIGHTSYVQCVSFSPDGKLIATGSKDRTIMLWSSAVQRADVQGPLKVFRGHADVVCSLAFSSDSKRICSASFDRSVRTWPLEDLDIEDMVMEGSENDLNHKDMIFGVACTPDLKMVLTVGLDKQIKLFSAFSGELLRTIPTSSSVNDVSVSPNGDKFATASSDKLVRQYDLQTGRPLNEGEGHTDRLSSLAYSPDGAHLLTGSSDKTVRVWDASSSSSRLLPTSAAELPDLVNGVSWSLSGSLVAAALEHNIAVILAVGASGLSLVRSVKCTTLGTRVNAVAFSPDEQVLAAATSGERGVEDRTLHFFSVSSGELLKVLPDFYVSYGDRIPPAAFSLLQEHEPEAGAASPDPHSRLRALEPAPASSDIGSGRIMVCHSIAHQRVVWLPSSLVRHNSIGLAAGARGPRVRRASHVGNGAAALQEAIAFQQGFSPKFATLYVPGPESDDRPRQTAATLLVISREGPVNLYRSMLRK